ncbi:MAG: hypothetical protein Q4E89_07345 [Eubacteriales bacterium]|nr:hypothetical protein [Eubacteriales bacterium]
MKNKKIIVLLAMAVTAVTMLSSCGLFGKDDEEPDQIVVPETPTPAPTVAPVATPTPVPQTTKYTSSDNSISIDLPDSTWSNRMDEGDTISFESTNGDRILILHGEGEEAMSQAVLPDTRDNAAALTATSDVVEGTDFEIQDYQSQKISGVDVYTYTVRYTNAEKGGGYVAVENYVIADSNEFYSIAGSVKENSTLEKVQASLKTFKILGEDSALGSATGTSASGTTAQGSDDDEGTDSGESGTSGDASGTGTAGTSDTGASTDTGTSTDTGASDYGSTDNTNTSAGGSYVDGSAMDLYTSGGVAFRIYQDGSGNWIDGDGNTFTFGTDGGAYDQYGNYYSQAYSYSYDNNNDNSYNYDSGYTDNSGSYGGSRDLYTSSGVAFGVYQDANGNWIDGDGNTFTFDENGVGYDQYGNAYNPG